MKKLSRAAQLTKLVVHGLPLSNGSFSFISLKADSSIHKVKIIFLQ